MNNGQHEVGSGGNGGAIYQDGGSSTNVVLCGDDIIDNKAGIGAFSGQHEPGLRIRRQRQERDGREFDATEVSGCLSRMSTEPGLGVPTALISRR
jgi:hypothetical protein